MNKLIVLIGERKTFFSRRFLVISISEHSGWLYRWYASHLFSSIFILIAYVPNAWGFHWSHEIETFLMHPYSYSMGFWLSS